MYVYADGKRALKGLVMKPFEQAPWAGALQQADGLLLKSKSLFPQGIYCMLTTSSFMEIGVSSCKAERTLTIGHSDKEEDFG